MLQWLLCIPCSPSELCQECQVLSTHLTTVRLPLPALCAATEQATSSLDSSAGTTTSAEPTKPGDLDATRFRLDPSVEVRGVGPKSVNDAPQKSHVAVLAWSRVCNDVLPACARMNP
jgi:hypothetical protein